MNNISPTNQLNNYLNKSRYLVLVDVGNSAIKLGLAELNTGFMQNTTSCISLKECHDYLQSIAVNNFFYSSVRPNFEIQSLCPQTSCQFLCAEPFIKLEKLSFLETLDIGIDRKLACIAANTIVSQPFLVITMGTATTLSFVLDNKCNFSVIWPGLSLAVNSIDNNTRIRVKPNFDSIITPDTTVTIQDSVNSGVFFSTLFTIERWVNYFNHLYTNLPNIVVTGGYSQLISKHLSINHILEPELTIKGLLKLLSHKEVKDNLEDFDKKANGQIL